MRSDIVIVYPPVFLSGRYGNVATGVEVPPQPLIYLGAVLRENNYSCSLLDANALNIDMDATVEEILSRSPKYVGISSPTMLIGSTGRIAKKLKERDARIKVLVGGPHMSAVPLETMERYRDIDIGIIGEGEVTIVELLQALDKGTDLGEVDGIIYREGGAVRRTSPRYYIEDLDTIPFPAWDMLPDVMTHYQQIAARIDRLPCLSIVTSRGCPFQCTFCARNVFGNVTRSHSADYLVNMVKFLKEKYKVKSLSFEDENFVVFKKRLREFCEKVIAEKIDITWDCSSHVNSIDAETLSLMKKAGCWQINFGIESGSQRILDVIKKSSTLARIEKALAMTKKAGILTKGYFIIGHPTETLESIQETIDFIKKIDLDIFQMSHMVPFPGTELYDTAHKYGTFDNDWENMNIWTPLFIPNGLTKEDLERESKRAYREFYFRPGPIFKFFVRMLRPSVFLKYTKDGIKIFKFLVKKG